MRFTSRGLHGAEKSGQRQGGQGIGAGSCMEQGQPSGKLGEGHPSSHSSLKVRERSALFSHQVICYTAGTPAGGSPVHFGDLPASAF